MTASIVTARNDRVKATSSPAAAGPIAPRPVMDLFGFDMPRPPLPGNAGPPDGADTSGGAPLRHAAWPDAGPIDAADACPFTLRSANAALVGTLASGVDAVVVVPHVVLTTVRVAGSRCVEATLTPLGVRRALRLPTTRVVEVIHSPAEPGLAWIDWTAEDEVSLEISWLLPHAVSESGGAAALRNTGHALAWHPHAGSDVAWCATTPHALSIRSSAEGADLVCVASFRLDAGATARLTMGLARAGDRPPAVLDPAPYLRARAASARRAERGRLRVQSPDARLDEAVHRAALDAAEMPLTIPRIGRIAAAGFGALEHHGRVDCGDAAVLAAAALVVGDFDAAAHTVRALRALRLPAGAMPETVSLQGRAGTASLRATALFAILAARSLAATGSHADASAAWPDVAAALEFLRELGSDDALARTARAEAATLAESIGVPPADSGSDLVGIAAANARRGGAPVPAPSQGWIDAAVQTDAETPAALRDASALIRFAESTIGFEPDAARGRVRLAPAFPDDWTACVADGLPVGDACVRFEWRRDGGRHRIVLVQESGAVPIRVVLEPRVRAAALTRATIDGQPADLDPRSDGTTLVVPVQLVLDYRRTLEIDVTGP